MKNRRQKNRETQVVCEKLIITLSPLLRYSFIGCVPFALYGETAHRNIYTIAKTPDACQQK